ncbi:asparagine synthase (glutamine-hydrolyzing) [Pedobacter sandarakinus]|uniref:asparagine synthase (glutamine-hydrolyzing) n=1 Tax=Pedobacter sandarakinus TaxID=353156 RepID=UPI002246AF03|nr:asparagine synthase (glutamine-hydrolyzing) [Pedobacter sandarakinus]MCX2574304.1 asparagine synthase (glutamine-hydrolyzing) [Pedobacter sandarakinus]
MCGIYGSTIQYGDEIVREKMARINFRGPDFTGITRYDKVIFAHNRLAIIDLDPRSNQPFSYMHLRIVFNGEVYNYQDIRRELVQKGYKFNTSSDTEVICAAYLEYGNDCVNRFNGMFAFVIYDTYKGILFGARDRFGKKPFYYALDAYGLEFASQPSQISIGRKLNIDEDAISQYLIWGYVPQPQSIWDEVKQLPAAHAFTYDLLNKKFKVHEYWTLDYCWKEKFTGSYDEAKNSLSQILADSVKIRMNADVPLGVFLSGGIDSSLIAAMATKEIDHVKTFSIKFNEKGFDESVYAEQVARHLGTDHHTIECNYDDGIELIENFNRYYDEPFADSSAIPTMLLSKHTRKHVTVALSGDAGDEAFLGYHRYKWIKQVNNLFYAPHAVRKALGSIINQSPSYRHKLIAMGIAMEDVEKLYVKMFGNMENSWVKQPDLAKHNPLMHVLKNPSKPLLERISDFDIKTYLNGDINTKVDRASMAFSLESRCPLMDYRVIEFARSLPTAYKYNSGNQKRILKDLLFEHVPAKMFDRPKAGFTMPFQHWFRNELRSYVMDNLSSDNLKNIPGIHIKRTQEIINEHMSGQWNRYPQIWKLLVLSQWLNKNKSSVKNEALLAV